MPNQKRPLIEFNCSGSTKTDKRAKSVKDQVRPKIINNRPDEEWPKMTQDNQTKNQKSDQILQSIFD